ncbi:MAG: hypothetical protein F6K39_45080, partial [Okeania sp. SIO3B3]|nr:hypothetical protein [Okeania sp. SIO3B3]
LEEGRQRELRELFAQHSVGKAEGKKRLKGIKFFITDPSEHDIKPGNASQRCLLLASTLEAALFQFTNKRKFGYSLPYFLD